MTEKLPNEIVKMAATRAMRLHHYLWHEIRNSWNVLTKKQQKDVRDLGWEPPHPALDKNSQPIHNNYSGEDFLYMHRQMIAKVNQKLAEINDPNYKKIIGWENVPAPDNAEYPIKQYTTGDSNLDKYLQRVKSNEFYEQSMKPLNDKFKNPEELKKMTLGELGSRIEFSIHNWMHMRWSEDPSATGIKPDPTPPYDGTGIDPKWDDPAYNWLGDTYSSHVNPIFWKLHGWVDARIDDWQKANNVAEIKWKGTWVGPSDRLFFNLLSAPLFIESISHDHEHHHDIAKMQKVLGILINAGACTHFYDDKSIFDTKNSTATPRHFMSALDDGGKNVAHLISSSSSPTSSESIKIYKEKLLSELSRITGETWKINLNSGITAWLQLDDESSLNKLYKHFSETHKVSNVEKGHAKSNGKLTLIIRQIDLESLSKVTSIVTEQSKSLQPLKTQ